MSNDDAKLMEDICDVMDKVFTKGKHIDGMICKLKVFQMEIIRWREIYKSKGIYQTLLV